jgi:hypothetical protein
MLEFESILICLCGSLRALRETETTLSQSSQRTEKLAKILTRSQLSIQHDIVCQARVANMRRY